MNGKHMTVIWRPETEVVREAVEKTKRLDKILEPSPDSREMVLSSASRSIWLRLVETLRTSASNYEEYQFTDLAAVVKEHEPDLALNFGN